jgi:UDP-sulfoquinovose synthase
MRVFIAGIDGYIGWALAQHLAAAGHTVRGIDNETRRRRVDKVNSTSAIPIKPLAERLEWFRDVFGGRRWVYSYGDVAREPELLDKALIDFEPDAIVNLAQQPSAPYSMRSRAECISTHRNNTETVLNLLWAMRMHAPYAHLVHIGTLGEYGTPGCPIPEGFFTYQPMVGEGIKLPFPRQPPSYYHSAKVASSHDIQFACRIWSLKATDIMQGVVYGTQTTGLQSATRFDFDEHFGTIVNRFCCQAVIGHPLTVYGAGGQTRGLLPLRDSIQCVELLLRHPPEEGYRVVNQFAKTYSINELAAAVVRAAADVGLDEPVVSHIENPRVEAEAHRYEPDCSLLPSLGYEQQGTLEEELRLMLQDLIPHKERVEQYREVIMPRTKWR